MQFSYPRCRRLIAAGGLPDRAGQPTQIQLHLTLEELARLHPDLAPGSAPAGDSQPGAGTGDGLAVGPDREYFGPAATPGDACDATIVPIVTGRVDQYLLGRLTATLAVATAGGRAPDSGSVSDLILANAVALLSGPGQLASFLRTGTLGGPAASVSLPIDLGTATETIPAHLRRAVILRDRHCMAPGCFQPAAGCHVHHINPRSIGGRTRLKDLILLCAFII